MISLLCPDNQILPWAVIQADFSRLLETADKRRLVVLRPNKKQSDRESFWIAKLDKVNLRVLLCLSRLFLVLFVQPLGDFGEKDPLTGYWLHYDDDAKLYRRLPKCRLTKKNKNTRECVIGSIKSVPTLPAETVHFRRYIAGVAARADA